MKRVQIQDIGDKGKGVFALENIQKGNLILIMNDSITAKDISVEEYAEYKKRDHIDYLSQGEIFMQSPEAYINHSCSPTTFLLTKNSHRKLFSMRNIKVGEEITYDYAINCDYEWGAKCLCLSKNCRGIIIPNFWKLPKEKQLEYVPYLDIWFREKYQKEVEILEKQLQH